MRSFENSVLDLPLQSVSLDTLPDSESYPFNLSIVKSINQGLYFESPITFITGENGSGKSTLIEAIAVALGLNPEGGCSALDFSTRLSHSSLAVSVRPITHFSPEPLFLD